MNNPANLILIPMVPLAVFLAVWLHACFIDWRNGRLILLLCLLSLASCTSTGGVMRGKDGHLIAAWLPTSLFGEVVAKDVAITTREGDTLRVGAVATHNPDREVTGAVRAYGIAKVFAPIAMESVKGTTAVALKATTDKTAVGLKTLDVKAAETAGAQANEALKLAPK